MTMIGNRKREILSLIEKNEKMYLNEISRHVGIYPAAVFFHLQWLEKAGYIQRISIPHYPRTMRIYSLTEKGKKTVWRWKK